MKAREGDMIETDGNLIFDVKGQVHPPDSIVAFIRYFPDENGKRIKNGRRFGKVYSLSRRYALLKERFSEFLVYDPIFDETICEVSLDRVVEHYEPAATLQEIRSSTELDPLQSRALHYAELLKEAAGVSWKALGISGSIMIGLHTLESDIDVIVYGSKNCRKVYTALRSMFNSKHELVRPYTLNELKTLFEFRSKDTGTGFEDFLRTEQRKVMQGKFVETDYFVRFVKDWNEIGENYGDVRYRNVGYSKIEAKVVDDSESTFTPCTYEVENVNPIEGFKSKTVTEIASFRGRFCEQARTGEIVVAAGKVEHITDSRRKQEYNRLLVGGRPSDFIMLK